MSDEGRKDFATRAQEELTPDAMKSTQDKVKESITDTGDRLARGLQSDESKSGAQEAVDKGERAHESSKGGESLGDKVKGALGIGK